MKKQILLLTMLCLCLTGLSGFDGVILPYKEISVTSRVTSQVESIQIQEGEFIKKGLLICKLSDRKILEDLLKAEHDLKKLYLENKKLSMGNRIEKIRKLELSLEISQVAFKELSNNFKALQKIFQTDGISRNEFEKKKNEIEIAKLNIEKAELDLKIAKETPAQIDIEISNQKIIIQEMKVKQIKQKLNEITLLSPISAYIKKISIKEGDYISEGGKIATLLDISKVYAESNISINQLVNFNIGDQKSVFIPLLEKQYTGKITAIFPEIDSATNTVKIRILIDNTNYKIKPGMLVDIK